MRVTVIQTDIVWEQPQENLRRLHSRLEELRGQADLVVLPEAFTTGFSTDCTPLAEPVSGHTISTLRQWAREYGMALAGSYIAKEIQETSGQVDKDLVNSSTKSLSTYYNRGFLLTPEGDAHFADKRHLFRMGNEHLRFSPGTERPIIEWRGWHILLLVCYDLRFPVWARNVGGSQYDLLLCVANWPAPRRLVWDTLLRARALENQCYVVGVNRIGTDAYNIPHNGGSILIDHRGHTLAACPDDTESTATALLDLPALHTFRRRFPAWEDQDVFSLTLP